MKSSNDFGPDCLTAVRDMCKLFGKAAKEILFKWSVTQCLSFKRQLEAGVRYFDLRVAPGKDFESTESAHFTHGLLCSTVEPCLREIASFLDEHPKEVVLLDFNHFYKMSGCNHTHLYDIIISVFGEKICPYVESLEERQDLSLTRLWDQGQQVIVFYQCDFAKIRPELWPASVIRAPWANTCDVTKLMSFLEEAYEYRHQGPMADIFYVCQGVLTPDIRYMMGHLLGNLRDDFARKVYTYIHIPVYIFTYVRGTFILVYKL